MILGVTLLRSVRPIRFDDGLKSFLQILVEVAVTLTAVNATGYWDSPLVFSLLTAIAVAGFARGFTFAFEIAGATIVAVGLSDVLRPDFTVDDLRLAAQWSVEILLVALVAGYTRRISGEATLRHTLAMDRLGRLADANSLLFSLHQVAQDLPASLDLDETLTSTIGRLAELFDYESAGLVLLDETDDSWFVARRDGPGAPDSLPPYGLPAPLARTQLLRGVVGEPNLLATGGPGLSPRAGSGIYAPLPARGSLIGVIAIEHGSAYHYTQRDMELLAGFAEPAALAIDNARWFARLRTVGADEERTRIARDLHDRIGQSLAYLAFELDRIVKQGNKGTDVVPALGQLREDVRGVIREVRDTLYDLRTDVSDAQDLPTTLQQFLDRVRERSGLEVIFRTTNTHRLPVPQEREMWRIAQEAVTNVERHADASRVTVTWRCDGVVGQIEIADDGKGFPIGRAGRLDSYGLLGMRERASSIGATLEVDSGPGRGTRVRCRLDKSRGKPG